MTSKITSLNLSLSSFLSGPFNPLPLIRFSLIFIHSKGSRSFHLIVPIVLIVMNSSSIAKAYTETVQVLGRVVASFGNPIVQILDLANAGVSELEREEEVAWGF